MHVYEVKLDPFVFHVKVEKDDDVYILRLGSSAFPDCASVHVFDRHKPIAELHGLLFNELCSSNAPLNKNDKGTQKLVKAIIAVTAHVFPHTTHFMLTDKSSVDCNELSKSVKLTDMYFCVYGKTWYEANFQAYPTFPTKYDQLKQALSQKPQLPFSSIWKKMPKDMKNRKHVQDIYKQSETWHDFFHEWYQMDGCIPFMYLPDVLGMITPVMKTLHGTDWVIALSSIDVHNVKIKELKTKQIPKIEWGTEPKPLRRFFGGNMAFALDLMDDLPQKM